MLEILMKKIICLSAILILTACNETPQNSNSTVQAEAKAPNQVSSQSNSFTEYKKSAQALVTLIDIKATDSEIEKSAEALVALSQPIIQAFKVKFPQCNEYLSAVSEAASIIPSLPLAEIETGYHADGKLPRITDVKCYHAKDLLVHPATVQAMAVIGIEGDEQREKAKHEVVEVIEHFTQVEQAYQG
jgi:hypothetical protein